MHDADFDCLAVRMVQHQSSSAFVSVRCLADDVQLSAGRPQLATTAPWIEQQMLTLIQK